MVSLQPFETFNFCFTSPGFCLKKYHLLGRFNQPTNQLTNQPGLKKPSQPGCNEKRWNENKPKKKWGPTGLPLMNPKKKSARKKESGWKFTPFPQNTPFFTSQRGKPPWSDVGWRGCAMFFLQQKNVEGCGELFWGFLGMWLVCRYYEWCLEANGLEAGNKTWKGDYLRLWLVDFSFQICKTP